MSDEARKLVAALRVVCGNQACIECPANDWCHGNKVNSAEDDAADMIEKLSAQLVNQATEYSRALKITTEQRDMLLATQDKLAALLSYVTGRRFSKTSYEEVERGAECDD